MGKCISLFLITGCLILLNSQLTAKISPGLDLGYDNGPGFFLHFTTGINLLKKTETRLGFGMSFPDPGNAALARKVFINDATNGIPEDKGRVLNFRIDFVRPLRLRIQPLSKFYFGARYAEFKGMFRYVGGNEEFDITSSNFGLGIGTEHYFRLTGKKFLKIITGVDYYFRSGIHGHDTTYNPGGDNINPRKDYTFSDADQAVNQPNIEFRIMIGFTGRR